MAESIVTEFEAEDNIEEPLQFWEQKQRELLTSVVDYNLSTLSDLIKDKNIDFISQISEA